MGPFEQLVESSFQRKPIGIPDHQKYDVDTNTMGRSDVLGYVSREYPGLGYVGGKGRYTIVHVPSGKKLAPAKTPPEARAIIDALGALTNWNVPPESLPSHVLNSTREVILGVKVGQFGYDRNKISFA